VVFIRDNTPITGPRVRIEKVEENTGNQN